MAPPPRPVPQPLTARREENQPILDRAHVASPAEGSRRGQTPEAAHSDAIVALRDAQRRLANTISPVLYDLLKVKFFTQLQRVAEQAGAEIDRTAATEALRANIERDAYLAVLGYSEWLAATIWRLPAGHPRTVVSLPECDAAAVGAIGERYELEPEVVQLVIAHIGRERTPVPPVGVIHANRVELTNDRLKEWASFYHWE